MHNLKNCSFTQKGENHLNLSCCILDAAKQNNAWKKCIFFQALTALLCTKIVLKMASKGSFYKSPKITFLSSQFSRIRAKRGFYHKNGSFSRHFGHLKAMNLTLEQFLANVRNFFMTFSKDTFFPVGGQKFIWRFEVKEAQKVAQLVPSCPSLKSKPIMNHKSYTTLYN